MNDIATFHSIVKSMNYYHLQFQLVCDLAEMELNTVIKAAGDSQMQAICLRSVICLATSQPAQADENDCLRIIDHRVWNED